MVNEYMEIPDWPGVWALGDCALIPDRKTGQYCPPTAQHALREGKVVAQNILAAIGRRTGVANIMGINFSGFIPWWLWRTIYLSKLPHFEKKLRVMFDWTLDLLFSKDLVQLTTIRAPTISRIEDEFSPLSTHTSARGGEGGGR